MTDTTAWTSEMAGVAGLESQLASVVSRAASEIRHVDCLDQEQRSEIYAILEIIRSDTDQHRTILGQWVSDRPGASHA